MGRTVVPPREAGGGEKSPDKAPQRTGEQHIDELAPLGEVIQLFPHAR